MAAQGVDPLLLAVLGQKVIHQQGDVFAALAKRRQLDGEDVDAIKKILAHASLFQQLHQAFVGGADDARAAFLGLESAYGGIAAAFEHPQQLDLHLFLDFAQFVEKERAVVRVVEQARFGLIRSGKRPLFISEKFALHQMGRDGAAVDRHETTAAAFAQIVNGPRHQLFAGARFAVDDHVGVGGRGPENQLVDLLHGRAFAHDVAEPVALLDGGPQADVLLLQARLLFLEVEFGLLALVNIHDHGLALGHRVVGTENR